MGKKTIKLDESELMKLVKESVVRMLTEGVKNRTQVSRDEILDKLNETDDDPSSGGKWATITYVKPMSVYKTKKSWRTDDVQAALDKNADRSGEDWHKSLSAFNQDGAKGKNPVSIVVVAKRYLLHWHTQEDFRRDSAQYGESLRNLRMKYGIGMDSSGYLGDNHNQRIKNDYGSQFNQTGNLSRDFNMAKADSKQLKTLVYLCDEQGNIITEIPADVMNAMCAKRPIGGVEKAVSSVLTGEALNAYIEAKKALDNEYRPANLLFSQILCIAACVNGESYYYINDDLQAPITKGSDIHVDPQKMIKIAQELLGENFEVLDGFAQNKRQP